MYLVETERLGLRNATLEDAGFFCALLNEPSWLQNIGDPRIRTAQDAQQYIQNKIIAQYEAFGLGMYLVELKAAAEPIGLCGLVKRDSLPGPDIGFALRPAFWSRGYAFEAAQAVMAYAQGQLGLSRLLAIVKPSNAQSIKLVERLGFLYEGIHQPPTGAEELRLYATEL
jgi:[ribosomal protein S5]-alanine N-acetyltransferase